MTLTLETVLANHIKSEKYFMVLVGFNSIKIVILEISINVEYI